jgi:hypothetical protein
MRRVSKYFYLPLTVFFIISALSLLLAWLGGEESIFGNFFSSVSIYTALIGVFLVFIHIVILILSFIVKNSKYIFLLLQYSFIISAVSLLIAWLGGEDSSLGIVFGGIGFYGAIICIYLFGLHLISLILILVFKNNSKT